MFAIGGRQITRVYAVTDAYLDCDRTDMTLNPPPLRVVFVIQKLAGLRGGAERVLVETAEAMMARGMDVRCVTLDPRPTPAVYGRQELIIDSLLPKVLRSASRKGAQKGTDTGRDFTGRALGGLKAIPNVFPLTHLKWMASHGIFSRLLRHDLQTRPADVVVAFMPPAITAAVRATRGLKIPVVASTHNVPEYDFGDSPRWDQNPLYRKRARAALLQAAVVTVLQPEFTSWFPASMHARVRVMPNPVTRLAPAQTICPRGQIVLGVGRLTPVKAWHLLIRAFAQMVTDQPGWQLRLFGDGQERAKLQELIDCLGLTGQTHLMGATGDIAAEYDQAAMLAHPSIFEGFGLVVAEAMAHGVPVLAFADCQGVKHLIDHNETGILLPRGTEDEAVAHLAAGLVKLAKEAPLRQRLGEQAAKIILRFDASAIYDSWAVVLHQVAEK